MAWVAKNSYVNGSRHFVTGEVSRTYQDDARPRYRRFRDSVDPACGDKLVCSGYEYEGREGFKGFVSGGLSVKSTINLLQKNICARCRKAFLATRPDLAAAVELLKAVG